MDVRTCSPMTNGAASKLVTLFLIMLISSACQPAPIAFRPPNQDELQTCSRDQGIIPKKDISVAKSRDVRTSRHE